MRIIESIKRVTPKPVKDIFRFMTKSKTEKYDAELSFWKSRLEIDKGKFQNAHYQKLMLGMAGEGTGDFVTGRVVADFGCGPRGSLAWAQNAALRIGIDVLADRYADEFSDNITSHAMVYLKCTEKVIPLPSNFIDILFTINAIDHVDNFPDMCVEILRVLKPGGLFIGSFNLEEPASPTEPQRLTEKILKEYLLEHLEIQSYRITEKGPKEDPYAPFFTGNLSYKPRQEGFLWVRARKNA